MPETVMPSPESVGGLATSLPPEVWATFAGVIDALALQRIFQGMSTAMTNGVGRLHLLFQSAGGLVGDGVALYNYFRALPIDLVLYNSGSVASVATVAFLGASERKTSARATFMIHRSFQVPQAATARRLESTAKGLVLDDTRTEEILRSHIELSEEKWKEFEYHDLTFSAEEAVEAGFAQEVVEFSPPAGAIVYSV